MLLISYIFINVINIKQIHNAEACISFKGNASDVGKFKDSVEAAIEEGFYKSSKNRILLKEASNDLDKVNYILSYMKIYIEDVKDLGPLCKYVAEAFEEAVNATSEEDKIAS